MHVGSVVAMKRSAVSRSAVLAPGVLIALALVAPACASDEAPTDIDSPGEDAPISTVTDGIDTEVEQGGNAGFEGEEDG